MRVRSSDAAWMGAAFAAALCVAAGMLGLRGAGVRGTNVALEMTGRLSFLLFWTAYAGGATGALIGPRLRLLTAHGREFGLAFAAAQSVHVGLVAWLCALGAAPDRATFIFFGAALLCMYALALFSIPRLHRALPPRPWWWLRNLAMTFILYAFAVDFLNHPLSGGARRIAEYLPFAALCIAAPILRGAAMLRRDARACVAEKV